jgi:hypothetical protein
MTGRSTQSTAARSLFSATLVPSAVRVRPGPVRLVRPALLVRAAQLLRQLVPPAWRAPPGLPSQITTRGGFVVTMVAES